MPKYSDYEILHAMCVDTLFEKHGWETMYLDDRYNFIATNDKYVCQVYAISYGNDFLAVFDIWGSHGHFVLSNDENYAEVHFEMSEEFFEIAKTEIFQDALSKFDVTVEFESRGDHGQDQEQIPENSKGFSYGSLLLL